VASDIFDYPVWNILAAPSIVTWTVRFWNISGPLILPPTFCSLRLFPNRVPKNIVSVSARNREINTQKFRNATKNFEYSSKFVYSVMSLRVNVLDNNVAVIEVCFTLSSLSGLQIWL
jgi:hypothetical protein